jgi:hypothetical protein
MIDKIVTFYRLGVINIIRVAWYRFYLKTGILHSKTPMLPPIQGDFFIAPDVKSDQSIEIFDWYGFSWINIDNRNIPNWYQSIINNKQLDCKIIHWSKLPDFSLNVGDIKGVWELSRFEWVISFALKYLNTGDDQYIIKLNAWINDWCENNPTNSGVNWKCGQEASIRVMHLCLTSLLLNQDQKLSLSISQLIEQHLSRIEPTLLYAVAQDNNHGTSEAVALFIGGIVLNVNSPNKKFRNWTNKGKYWLENRINKLVLDDGTFSQYSVNYHRLMLDSICLAEIFRKKTSNIKFSISSNKKIILAIDWLRYFSDENGSCPNIGQNDGARIIPISGTKYNDFRPTVQLASVLFYGERAYSRVGIYDQPLKLLNINSTRVLPPKVNYKDFREGGFAYLSNESSRLFFRYPVFKFRPSHSDGFHVDLWVKGNNIFRDAGSFSYNTDKEWLDYFPSTKAHNTVQFSDREQMPKISRFLYGSWLRTAHISGIKTFNNTLSFSAEYKDFKQAIHNRSVYLSSDSLKVIDNISGFDSLATVRFRLPSSDFKVSVDTIECDDFRIKFSSTQNFTKVNLVDGWESIFYCKKEKIKVLELVVDKPSIIETTIIWN